jgi:hypothetical protein
MRQLKNLSKDEQSQLETNFPEIVEQVFGFEDDVPGYSWLAISLFDHWLSKEEHHLIDDVQNDIHLDRLCKLHSFSRKIIENTEALTFRCKGKKKDKPVFKKFVNQEAANKYCESSTETTARFNLYVLVLPEYECIIKESRNYTNNVYYRNEELIKPFLDIVRERGLKVIDKVNQNSY